MRNEVGILFEKIRNSIMSKENLVDKARKYGVEIGKECEVYQGVNFGSEPYLISIGDHVRITNGVRFITHDGGVWVLRKLLHDSSIDMVRRITIGNNVHIGINTIIMPGVNIGNNCIIGCGAVVTKNIPDGEIWGGVPAKKIKSIYDYAEEHKNEFQHTKNLNYEEKKEYLKNNLECNKVGD